MKPQTGFIPENEKRIRKKAFYNCKKLDKITLKTKKLKAGSVGKDAFKNISKKAKVKCPSAKLAKTYKPILTGAGAPKTITVE